MNNTRQIIPPPPHLQGYMELETPNNSDTYHGFRTLYKIVNCTKKKIILKPAAHFYFNTRQIRPINLQMDPIQKFTRQIKPFHIANY